MCSSGPLVWMRGVVILMPRIQVTEPAEKKGMTTTYWQNVHSSTTAGLFAPSNKLGVIHIWIDSRECNPQKATTQHVKLNNILQAQATPCKWLRIRSQ